MEGWELPLATGNLNQQAIAHLDINFISNMPNSHSTHGRYRYSEPSKMTDPVDSYLAQQCVSAKSELSELIDPYFFGTGTPFMLDADLFKKIQAEQWVENLDWEQASRGNEVLDTPSWSTASTPQPDMFTAQTAHSDTPTAEQRTDDKKDGVHAPDIEKRNSKRRKRSTSTDHTEKEDKEEQNRLQRIVKDLEKFENQQKTYGQKQLKAIKDGIARDGEERS
ncbi:hypothetical protein GGI35DRAFT_477857 [Trichoderma velutinum]